MQRCTRRKRSGSSPSTSSLSQSTGSRKSQGSAAPGAPFQELLAYDFPTADATSTTLRLRWADRAVPVRIETTERSTEELLAIGRAAAANEPESFHLWEWVGYLLREKVAPETVEWASLVVANRESFFTLQLKASALASNGHFAEAIATGEEAMRIGEKALADNSDQFISRKGLDKFEGTIGKWRESESGRDEAAGAGR